MVRKLVKFFVCTHHPNKWGVKVYFHVFLISALDAGKWSALFLSVLPQAIMEQVGHRAGWTLWRSSHYPFQGSNYDFGPCND